MLLHAPVQKATVTSRCCKWAGSHSTRGITRSGWAVPQAQGRGGEDSEGGQAAEAGQQHQVLYAASQALLYVLCFRMEALVRQPSPPALQQQASSLGKPALAAAPEGAALRQLLRTTLPPLLRHKCVSPPLLLSKDPDSLGA